MRRIPQVMAAPGKKLVPFFTAGYPQLESTVPLVLAAEKAGAQLVELGMPFSDPLADGPVIQQSSQTALENGVTVPWILKTVARIREQSQIPIILMGYINPIRRMGAARFLEEAAGAGVDGLIIPDLPPEEPQPRPGRSQRQDEEQFLDQFMYLLTGPYLAYTGYEDLLPRRDEITTQRLARAKEIFEQEMCTE
ncbi:MAG: tryptophan synthase subunit alpha, partial [Candidatus Marinimicrobia bacterium]|nr:tryptophan synthase subunit alpha [Candidatus Neomarinimicrobiota bacterium]